MSRTFVSLTFSADSCRKMKKFSGIERNRKDAGFSLIEILVAFSILAISLGVLLHIFSGGLRTAIVSEEYQQALAIAQAQLARAGTDIPLAQGSLSGVEQEKFAWSMQVTLFELPQVKSTLDTNQLPATMQAFKVKVIVEWEEGQDNRSVVLNSVHLAKVQQ
jgi:general secretion pathway protein I